MYDIYLSGPMTGYQDFNYPAFNAAARELRAIGFVVFNPAENFQSDPTRSRSEYMRLDIEAVLQSSMLVALPGWESSTGARLEIAIAQELTIPIVPFDEMLAAFAAPATIGTE